MRRKKKFEANEGTELQSKNILGGGVGYFNGFKNLDNFEKIEENPLKIDKKSKFIENFKQFFIWFLISFVVLLVASNNSFLYKFNDSIDLNWYITMGQGLLDGKIPYRDLFEQKGPIVYFVFAFVAIFNNPYIVVWIFEVISFTIFLYFSYKLANRIINKYLSYVAIILLAVVVTTSRFFYMPGGALEEYCLPILAYFLLKMFEFIEDRKDFGIFNSFMIGLLVSIMFWMKYTLLVIPFVMLAIYFIVSIKRKKFKELIKSILMMILGFVVISLPVLLFFALKGALKDLLNVYFYQNLFKYSSSNSSSSTPEKYSISNIFMSVLFVLISVFFMVFGLISYIIKNKKQSVWFICLVVCSALLQLFVKLYLYYFLLYEIFAILGIAYVLQKFGKREFKHKKLAFILTIIFAEIFSLGFSNHNLQLFMKVEDYPQVYFTNIIRNDEIENPTLFCYNMADFGFYNALNVSPNQYYFAKSNFTRENKPEMYEAFDNAVKNAEADYVVAKEEDYNNNFELFEKYELIATKSYTHHKTNYDSCEYKFVLLKRV